MTARRAVDRNALKRFWFYTQYGNPCAMALQLMAHNRTPVTPPLSRGIKRCSRLWSRQYFPFPLKLFFEHFIFSETDWLSFLSENTIHLKHVTNINSGGFWILDDAIFASKHFNTSFHVTQQEYMLIVQEKQLRNYERSPYAPQQQQKKLYPREKKRKKKDKVLSWTHFFFLFHLLPGNNQLWCHDHPDKYTGYGSSARYKMPSNKWQF